MVNAATPEPPYYVVCFSSQLSDDARGYEETAQAILALAQSQPGFLGYESARNPDGFGITNSFWQDEASIRSWRENAKHKLAQKLGVTRWYHQAFTRVARVERAYESTIVK